MKLTRGSSLVELILYTGLLTTILVVLYQLFAIAGYRKIGEVVEDELYVNSSRVFSDLYRTVQSATSITEPISGESSSTLRLNAGATLYQLDENNRLVKIENGTTAFLTSKNVSISSLTFSRKGPSVQSQTITVDLRADGTQKVEGRTISEDFTTSITVR